MTFFTSLPPCPGVGGESGSGLAGWNGGGEEFAGHCEAKCYDVTQWGSGMAEQVTTSVAIFGFIFDYPNAKKQKWWGKWERPSFSEKTAKNSFALASWGFWAHAVAVMGAAAKRPQPWYHSLLVKSPFDRPTVDHTWQQGGAANNKTLALEMPEPGHPKSRARPRQGFGAPKGHVLDRPAAASTSTTIATVEFLG